MKKAVLFDLGGTLAGYYQRHEFPGILQMAVSGVAEALEHEGLLRVPRGELWGRVEAEDHEALDHMVRPLEGRLSRIFGVEDQGLLTRLCEVFMEPIFRLGYLYPDTLKTLRRLRGEGFRTAIISNTPWGSPARLWRGEADRLGLTPLVDALVFCRDVGWRKPARQVFEHTLRELGASPGVCLFVGDDPRWDLVGPRAVGIDAVIIDRFGGSPGSSVIGSLDEVFPLLHESA